MHTSPRHRRAFTLIEVLIASAILAMSIGAILMPFVSGAKSELEDARRTLAVTLAQELMEEILSKPFRDPDGHTYTPGPAPGRVLRHQFKNIDDYHGFQEPAGTIRSFGGSLIDDPAAEGLSRHVTATYVYVSGQDTGQDPNFIRVVVDVRHNGRKVATLTRLVYELH